MLWLVTPKRSSTVCLEEGERESSSNDWRIAEAVLAQEILEPKKYMYRCQPINNVAWAHLSARRRAGWIVLVVAAAMRAQIKVVGAAMRLAHIKAAISISRPLGVGSWSPSYPRSPSLIQGRHCRFRDGKQAAATVDGGER